MSITSSELAGTVPVLQFSASSQWFGPVAAVSSEKSVTDPEPAPDTDSAAVNGTPAVSPVPVTVPPLGLVQVIAAK